MAKLFNYFIPLVSIVYFLLILKGIIKLPTEKQQKFDNYISNRKDLMLYISYLLIIILVILIVKGLFFTNPH